MDHILRFIKGDNKCVHIPRANWPRWTYRTFILLNDARIIVEVRTEVDTYNRDFEENDYCGGCCRLYYEQLCKKCLFYENCKKESLLSLPAIIRQNKFIKNDLYYDENKMIIFSYNHARYHRYRLKIRDLRYMKRHARDMRPYLCAFIRPIFMEFIKIDLIDDITRLIMRIIIASEL